MSNFKRGQLISYSGPLECCGLGVFKFIGIYLKFRPSIARHVIYSPKFRQEMWISERELEKNGRKI